MRLVSLFSGTGAFELGFERAGFTVVGQCEFDPHAQSVLKRHWPDVPLHDDIKTLKGDTFGPAEAVVWGSPCQGLSVAGLRAGMADERSGLFTEGIRFIRELRHVTNDQYPRFSVWENVPGALSSNGGRDFRSVLEAFCEAEVPMPRSGKWAYAGVVRGHGREVAWRVLDSQHFGVAQRRRRVFVVTDFGGHSAAEVLFEREGVPGHPPQGREAWSGTAAHPRGGAQGVLAESGVVQSLTGGLGSGGPDAQHAQAGWLVPAIANALTAREGKGADSSFTTTPVIVPVAFAATDYKTGRYDEADIAETLTAGTDRSRAAPIALAYPIQDGRGLDKSQNGAGVGGEDDPAYTVDTTGAQSVAVAFEPRHFSERDRMGGAPSDVAAPVKATDGKAGDAAQHVAVAFAMRGRAEGNVPEANGERVSALRGSSGGSTRDMVATRYAVRRLMPVETERLQGMPDGWTEVGHYVEQAADRDRLWNAKERRRPTPEESGVIIRKIADTHRYRLVGNAVTVNVAEWLGHRVAAALGAEALEEAA